MRAVLLIAAIGIGVSVVGCHQFDENNSASQIANADPASSLITVVDRTDMIKNSNFYKAKIADRYHNYTDDMHWWMKVVEEGDGLPDVPGPSYRNDHNLSIAIAEGRIGYYYEEGLGVPQDYEKAAYWYHQSINNPSLGYAGAAKERLAFLYAKGLGVPRDPAKARVLFAASGGLGREAAELVEANELPSDMTGVPAAYARLKAEKAQKEEAAETAAAEERFEQQHPIARSAPALSDTTSQPSALTCHVMGVMRGIAGCPPWSW